MAKIKQVTAKLLIAIIRLYRYFLSPWIGNQCRFYPSCSYYAQQAIVKRGIFLGLAFTVWRLLRCQPFAAGGYDPVPSSPDKK